MTDRDSLLPFLIRFKGTVYTATHLLRLGPTFLRFLLGSLSRQRTKEKILEQFIQGQTLHALELTGEEYALGELDHFIRPEPLQRLAWHQAQGHRCVLISASPEFYLKPWAALHGFETVLGSQLEINALGKVTGRLLGLNCWGPEKVRRLIAYAGAKQHYQLYAYGDSRGDRELLDFADYPFYRKFK
jgi:HAD superfamily hydrolase (TIGR01490 family)